MSTSASPPCQACGTAQSPSAQQAVRTPSCVPGVAEPSADLECATEMFAATGWRVGWLIGPASIITPTLAATTRIVFCSNSPLQEASAVGIEQAKKRGFLQKQCAEYAERRNILTDAFDKLGMNYTIPQGSYFVLLVSDTASDRLVPPLIHPDGPICDRIFPT